MPAEGEDSSSSSSSGSSSSSTAGSTPHSSSGGNGLSKGAIAGIVVACVAFVAILGALFFVLGRNRVYRQWMSSQDGRNERTTRWALFNGASADPYHRSELDSNATPKPPATEITSISSPDHTTHTFSTGNPSSLYGASSPQQESGHWGWDASQHSRANRGPTELEAHPVVPEALQTREYH